MHGPTTILCTQAQPVSCGACFPDPVASSVEEGNLSQAEEAQLGQASDHGETSKRSSADLAEAIDTAPTSIGSSPEMTASNATRPATKASRNPEPLPSHDRGPLKRFSAFDSGNGCESCTIYIPDDTSKQLPAGAPGSPKGNSPGRNGSPVLRSREDLQVYGSPQHDSENEEEPAIHLQSSPESFTLDASATYHKHTVTYISTSSPVDSDAYSVVRNATVRTLSCELLPRGLTAGELSFGDPVNGYTIAYKFRVPDQHARGRYRQYALMALASNERRASQATTMIWSRFQHIAADIMSRTEQAIQAAKGTVEEPVQNPKSGLMPVSSFLTARMSDPDGFPRQNGGFRPKARGLADMVGNEKFFAELHLHFIALLRALRGRFGG